MNEKTELFGDHEIHVRCRPGSDVDEVAEGMVELAKKFDMTVKTSFNDVILTATPKSKPGAVSRQYPEGLAAQRLKGSNRGQKNKK